MVRPVCRLMFLLACTLPGCSVFHASRVSLEVEEPHLFFKESTVTGNAEQIGDCVWFYGKRSWHSWLTTAYYDIRIGMVINRRTGEGRILVVHSVEGTSPFFYAADFHGEFDGAMAARIDVESDRVIVARHQAPPACRRGVVNMMLKPGMLRTKWSSTLTSHAAELQERVSGSLNSAGLPLMPAHSCE